jgi:hypothetical protein
MYYHLRDLSTLPPLHKAIRDFEVLRRVWVYAHSLRKPVM